jgi:hypothetical protein
LGYVNGIAVHSSVSPAKVRRNTIDRWNAGVFCACAFPDLGTTEDPDDPGNNSILLDNTYWVRNTNMPPSPSVYAQGNWWGTPHPETCPGKFSGESVVYAPWLKSPPGGFGGGQSAATREVSTGPELFAPVPNPIRSAASVRYQVGTAGPISLRVFDLSGRSVRTLVSTRAEPGRYAMSWDRRDDAQRRLAEGIYFLRLNESGFVKTVKVILQ